MINITNKKMCSGCEVCTNTCPKKCIHMEEDSEGFLYPIVDQEACINCGACERVCPNINVLNHNKSTDFYAAYNKNGEIVRDSSSGGIVWKLVELTINNNGCVYGVYQDSTNNVQFSKSETLEDCMKYRKSKYLQARTNDIYTQVRKDLQDGREVLFTGTPCQIAALYKFLGSTKYENLLTCDIVCHGVPSRKVYRKYIAYLEEKMGKKVVNVIWRDKVHGWGPNHVTVIFEDGTKYTRPSQKNEFQRGFLTNFYLRPSCYECNYAKLPRVGDFSLADFWGYEGELKEKNQNQGISLLMVSSDKGRKVLEKIKKDLIMHPVTEELVKQKCRHAYTTPLKNNERNSFMHDIDNYSFDRISKKYNLKNNMLYRIERKIRLIKGGK